MSARSPWWLALEIAGWIVLSTVAIGAAVLIGLLVSIDCNGIWNDRPDRACMDRKSWMSLIPVALLFALVGVRVWFAGRGER